VKKHIIAFLTLIAAIILLAQDVVTWSKTYTGEWKLEEEAYDAVQTPDGGYIVVGSKWDHNPQSPDWQFPHMWILKLDENGDSLWAKTYYYNIEISDPLDNDYYYRYAEAFDVELTLDGGYAVCGYIQLEFGTEQAMCILKLDKYGQKEWVKAYLFEERNNIARSIRETSNGGFIVGGTAVVRHDSTYENETIFIKLTSEGDSLWSRRLRASDDIPGSESKSTTLEKMILDSDDIIYGVGYYDGYGYDGWWTTNGWAIKIDNSGNVLWDKSYGGIEGEGFRDACISSDNNILLLGYQYLRDSLATAVWINKIDTAGNVLIEKIIHSGEEGLGVIGNALTKSVDGGYCIGADISKIGIHDNWLIKLDAGCDTIWTKLYSSEDYSFINSVHLTNDNGYVLCGQTGGSGIDWDWTDLWVIKVDQEGNLASIENNEEFVQDFKLYQNYPNPFNNGTKIQFNLEEAAEIELNIYNAKGELVQNLVQSKLNKGKHDFSFKAVDINSGVYFYRLNVDGVAKDTKKMLYLK